MGEYEAPGAGLCRDAGRLSRGEVPVAVRELGFAVEKVDSQTSMSAPSARARAASHIRVSMMNANRWPGLRLAHLLDVTVVPRC